MEAAAERAAERLKALASRRGTGQPSPGPSELEARYEELLDLPGIAEPRKPEILLRLAELAYREEEASLKGLYESEAHPAPGSRYPRSIEYHRRLVDTYPGSPQALTSFYNLGYLYAEEGKTGLSTWAYGEVLRRDPQTPYADEIHMRLGEAAFDGGEMVEAIAQYRAVVERGNPEYVDKALYKLGWCFYNLNDFPRAVEAFAGVMDRNAAPGENLRQETLEIMARSFMEWGGVSGVRRHLATARQGDSYGDRLYRALGNLYAEASRYEDAAAAYAAGVEAYPVSASCLAMEKGLVSALLIRRDLEAANNRRESWIRRYGPGSPWAARTWDPSLLAERDALLEEGVRLAALYWHGQAQRGQGGLARALDLYARYLELFPADTEERYEISFAYAQALKEAGRFDEADAQYLSVATHPTRTSHREEASYRRIELLQSLFAGNAALLGRLAAAQEKYAELNPHSPLVPKVLFAEGELYLAADRFPLARAAFSRVFQEHPESGLAVEALERTARCHFREGSYGLAESFARRALSLRPGPDTGERATKLVSLSAFKQGEAAEASGDLEEANRHFLRLSEEFSGTEVAQVALFRAAENLRRLGRPAEAARIYGRAARSYPGTAYARNALALAAESYSSLEDWVGAAGSYEELFRADPEAPKAPEILLLAGSSFERGGELSEAARVYAEFSRRYPDHARRAEALHREGSALRELGRTEEARDRFEKAWEAGSREHPDIYPARASLALADMTLAELGKVELKGDLEESLGRKEALLRQALEYLARAASLPYAETVTAALYRAGKAYEDLRDAILSSERPPELTGEEREQYDFLLEEKAAPLEQKAIEYYRKGVAAARTSAVHTEWVDRMYRRLEALIPWAYQRPEEPATAWVLPDPEDLPPADPLPTGAHLEATWGTPVAGRYALLLARARLQAGDLEGAAEAADLAVRQPRADPAAWTVLGDVRQARGLAAAAAEAYGRALGLRPGDYAATVNLGVLRLGQGEVPAAESLFRTASDRAPDLPEAWNDLGLARRAGGDYEGARAAFERALAARVDFPAALKNLGILNEKYLGLPAQAIPYYDRYLALKPGDPDVERWRKVASRRLQDQGGTP